jgi:hypothetical protein
MGPLSYMRSIFDRNVVVRRMTVLVPSISLEEMGKVVSVPRFESSTSLNGKEALFFSFCTMHFLKVNEKPTNALMIQCIGIQYSLTCHGTLKCHHRGVKHDTAEKGAQCRAFVGFSFTRKQACCILRCDFRLGHACWISPACLLRMLRFMCGSICEGLRW